LTWYEKKLNLTQQKHSFTYQKNVLEHKINRKKNKIQGQSPFTKSGLETERVFSQRKRKEEISKDEVKKG